MATTKAKLLKRRNELALEIARTLVELSAAKTPEQRGQIQAVIDMAVVRFQEFDSILSDADEGEE